MPLTSVALFALLALTASQSHLRAHSYLALGDSYTVGERVQQSASFPFQLAAAIEQSGVTMDSPEVLAKTGWTTDELEKGISDAAIGQRKFDLVTLLIGVNNQYRGRPVSEFEGQFTQLLNWSIALANGGRSHVVVVSIPDWSVTPFAKGRNRAVISHEIDLYNQVTRDVCKRNNVVWVDITGISKRAASDGKLVAPDGLHPTGKMYAEWVAKLLPAAKKAILGR